jgi:hypothetical protein
VILTTLNKNETKMFEPFCKKELQLKFDELYKMYYVEIEE